MIETGVSDNKYNFGFSLSKNEKFLILESGWSMPEPSTQNTAMRALRFMT